MINFQLDAVTVSGIILTIGGGVVGLVKYANSKETAMLEKVDKKADKEDVKFIVGALTHISERIDKLYELAAKETK